LDTAYPGIPVSGEAVNPEFDPPHFFVELLESSHVQELGRRYRRAYPFVIRYISLVRTNDEMYAVAEQLTSVLQSILIGDRKYPGQNMRFQIIDEVLHFFVDYHMFVWNAAPDDPKMHTFELNEGVDAGG